ncbi:DUF6479 family protein [Streptacidiphilus rugosus]|uniref:DUF6479 family protein n=1 Tax=Streptacidiphilus rugosus TaxID=405783 RepID=UPI00056BD23C|nr:DUF6479 family protein [Streptacidiphilus rugosus]
MTIRLAQLASGFGAVEWSMFVIGVLIAAVLIAAFVWGSRRKRREPPPRLPSRAESAPDPDSWSTPEGDAGGGAGESPAHGGPTRHRP